MIAIINGPNLNLIGRREPEFYGTVSFEHFLRELRKRFTEIPIEYYQSNHEGDIIDFLHNLGYDSPGCKGIVINPGAYAHYSYAIADAIAAISVPVIEVHISNILSREEFRKVSVTSSSCRGMICGCGLKGYELAVEALTSSER